MNSVVAALILPHALQAQSHILFGDLIVHEKKAKAADRGAFTIILNSISGRELGRQTIGSGGRYRFLSVPNGDYILVVELGNQEIARMDFLLKEFKPTDIRKNLEFEWKNPFPGRTDHEGSGAWVYARPPAQKQLFLEAELAQSRGDLAAAQELLTRMTREDAEDFEAWTELGSVLFRLSQPKPAESAYLRALSLRPDLVVAHQNLGKLYFDQKEYEKSSIELEAVLATTPDVPEVHMLLGEDYLQMKQGSKAVVQLEKALQLAPLKMADAHLRLASLYRAAGYTDLAITQYRLYLQKRPLSPGKKEIEQYIAKNTSRN